MQIKKYTSYQTSHIPLYQEIFNLTQATGKMYPNYPQWFQQTFLAGLKKQERMIIVAQESKKPVGCALIKNTPDEKKICTLFVHPDFRHQGIAQKLITASLKELGEHPLLTVSEKNLFQIQSLLKKNGFRLSGVKKGIYRPEETEYYFNDPKSDLIKDGLIPVLIQRMKQLRK